MAAAYAADGPLGDFGAAALRDELSFADEADVALLAFAAVSVAVYRVGRAGRAGDTLSVSFIYFLHFRSSLDYHAYSVTMRC